MPTKEQREKFMEIRNAAKAAGIAHPEIIAAQWALESGWGKRESGKHNYWGVKAGNGDPDNQEKGTVRWTKENVNGRQVRMRQKFRDYDSLDEALQDRQKFVSRKNGRYDRAGYFQAETPAEAADALQRGGYATDPNYANKLKNILRSVGIDPKKTQNDEVLLQPNTQINKPVSPIHSNGQSSFADKVNSLAAALQAGSPYALREFVNANHTELESLSNRSIRNAEALNQIQQAVSVQTNSEKPQHNQQHETTGMGVRK